MAGYTDTPGPKVGNVNRKRNTVRNLASKKQPYGYNIPAISPQSSVQYSQDLASKNMDYFSQLAQIKTQRGEGLAALNTAEMAAKQQRIAGVAHAEAQALDTGMLGSSTDALRRIAVEAQSAQDIATARNQWQSLSSGLTAQAQQLKAQHQLDLFNTLAQKAAEKSNMNLNNFKDQNVMRPPTRQEQGGAGGGGGGGGNGQPGVRAQFNALPNQLRTFVMSGRSQLNDNQLFSLVNSNMTAVTNYVTQVLGLKLPDNVTPDQLVRIIKNRIGVAQTDLSQTIPSHQGR